MKLFLLKQPKCFCPSATWLRALTSYDVTAALVIRAPDEVSARNHAATFHGDEGSIIWLKPEHTTCEELSQEGPLALIIRDFRAG